MEPVNCHMIAKHDSYQLALKKCRYVPNINTPNVRWYGAEIDQISAHHPVGCEVLI
jgi:hypothetical protein